mgnify:CR=1 FL=1
MLNKSTSIKLITQIRALDKLEQNISKVLNCSISQVISDIIEGLSSALESGFDVNWNDELYDKLYDKDISEYELYDTLCSLEEEVDL